MEQLLDYRLDIGEQSRWEIISASAAAKQHLLYLQEVGDFYAGPGYYTIREGLPSYLIKFSLSGSGILEYGSRQYQLNPGDFFWIDCMQHQDYRTAPDCDHWHILWVHLYGVNAADYYELFSQLNGGSPVGHLPEGSGILQFVELLLQLYKDNPGELSVDVRCANLLSQLLTGLLESVTAIRTEFTLPPVISAVCTYLAEHYQQRITLDDLSRRFNVSKFHLQRSFCRIIGRSPSQYQQKIRITKAKEFLQTTNLSVGLIANSVGFESTSYFIAAFKAQEGITPLKYRTAWAHNLPL